MTLRNFQFVVLGLAAVLLFNTKIYSTEIRVYASGFGGFLPGSVNATLGDTITWYTNSGFTITPRTFCNGSPSTILPTGAPSWNQGINLTFSYIISVAGHYLYAGLPGSHGTIDVTATLLSKISLEACSPNSDSIIVYLRSSNSPYEIRDISTGVLDPEGDVTLQYNKVASSTGYYIVGKHRNSIETWSKFPQTFNNGIMTYDFTTGVNKAFGHNMVLVNGRACFYTGDVNQDGTVDGNDFALIESDVINFVPGYMLTDLNCDEIVDGTDFSYADNNVLNSIIVIRP